MTGSIGSAFSSRIPNRAANLLGGSIVDANALLRAYIWHCVAIPIIASAFMVVHFWRVRKDGGISGPAPMMLEKEIKDVRKI